MNRQLRSYWAVAQLDLAEVLRSRWLIFCVVVYAVRALGMARRTARELVMVGRRLRELPVVEAALGDGSPPVSVKVALRRLEGGFVLAAPSMTRSEGSWIVTSPSELGVNVRL